MLKEGKNCWRTAEADRAAILIDSAAYFRAAKKAILKARKSIILVGWVFNPQTPLDPDAQDDTPDTIGELLNHVAERRPELDIRVLIWDMAFPLMAANKFFPHRAAMWVSDHVKFRLDPCDPPGASHHQKILVVDDELAFCGGGDFSPERWDCQEHKDNDSRRVLPDGDTYPPRHEVMLMVEGPAAKALGDVARNRWLQSGGGPFPDGDDTFTEEQSGSLWPEGISVDFRKVGIGVSRTVAATNGTDEVRENECLFFDSIASAKDLIVIENQYFTAPYLGAALAARLQEPDGPELVVISTHQSPGMLDGLCMDAARDRMVKRLKEIDVHKRFHIYSPHTKAGDPIIVHSKVAIIDDTFVRVGSSNFANRSMGFDTECDVSVWLSDKQSDKDNREGVTTFRNRLIGHYLGISAERVAKEAGNHKSLSELIDTLDNGRRRRLRPLSPRRLWGFQKLIARFHLGDPLGASDVLRPWRRKSFRDTFEAALATRSSATSGK